MFIADTNGRRLRLSTTRATTGTVSTIAGAGKASLMPGGRGALDSQLSRGTTSSAPTALLADASTAAVLRRGSDNPAFGVPRRLAVPAALGALLRSNLLRALSGYVLLFTATATLLYVEQARIVARASGDERERTLLFARVDLAVNASTFVLQACVATLA